ncbi:hypothetical protein [Streptomyces sp. 5-10]|uniref:hypothetical protein n=1 Tax=Streptomyces sp. 5-10 TaxID=878925 RepID=UPI00168BC125|nr:hypothetical protein [Streptomyces sp. 5-10]MBD3004649.1 hypothetical protein [Streptomyces sp. 5-10]
MKLFWKNRKDYPHGSAWKVGLFQLSGDVVLTVVYDEGLDRWWIHPPRNAYGETNGPWSNRGPILETSSRSQVDSALEAEIARWLNSIDQEERQTLVNAWEDWYRNSGQEAPWLSQETGAPTC